MTENEIKILIVEDEAIIAESIKIQLENFGFCIVGVYYHYEPALKALYETEYDLLITDINLGNGIDEKSGIQLAQQSKQIKNCPIVFNTAFGDKDTIQKASEMGPSAYLVKPINAINLYATIQLAINNYLNKIEAFPEMSRDLEYFFAKQGNKILKIWWKEVYHLEYVKNYVKIKYAHQKNTVLVRGSLLYVMQNMVPPSYKNNFVKINRSEAIAISCIVKINKDKIETNFGDFPIIGELNLKNLYYGEND